MLVRAERDMMAVIKHDKTEHVGNDETHAVGATLTRGVARDQARSTVPGNAVVRAPAS